MTSRAHCMLVFVVKNSKRDTHLSFYVFPKEKNLRRRWLHSISRKNVNPTTGHRVCSLHFKGGKKPTWTMFLLFFLWQNLIPGGHPNQETQPSPSLPASTTTPKADESERDRQEIRRLREELGNVLRLKGSLERDLFILKFGLKRF